MRVQEIIRKGVREVDALGLSYYVGNGVKGIIKDMEDKIRKNTVPLDIYNKKTKRNVVLMDRIAKQSSKLVKANSDLVWFRKHFEFDYEGKKNDK